MRLTVCVVALLLVALLAVASRAQDPWTFRYPDPTEATLNAAAYGNGVGMVVGNQGTLMSSTDAVNWRICESPADGDYDFIYYTDAFYMSTTIDNNLYVSQEGGCDATWLPMTGVLANEDLLNHVRISPSPVPEGWALGFVGVASGKVYVSDDGSTWTQALTEEPTSMEAWAVAWNDVTQQWLVKFGDKTTNGDNGHDVYMAAATPGSPPLWSELINTTFQANDDYSLGVCTAGNATVFVTRFGQGMAESSDGGLTWKITQPSVPGDEIDEFLNMACSGSRCVAIVDDDEFWESEECTTGWTNPTPSSYQKAIDNFPVIFPVGEAGAPHFLVGSENGALFSSGMTDVWAQVGANQAQVSTFVNCDDLIWTGSGFLATCYRTVLHSADGRAWTSLSYDLGDDDEQLTEPTPGERGFLVARSGKHYLSYSDDWGQSWSYLMSMWLFDDDDDFNIGNGMAYVNDHWVVDGYDQLPDSDDYFPLVIGSDSDADHWEIFAPNYWILDFAWSPLLQAYVGAGKGGVYTATNLYDWTPRETVNGDCEQIASNGANSFVAVCSNYNNILDSQDSVFMSSQDGGVTWTTYRSPCTTSELSGIGILCDNIQYMEEMQLFFTHDDSATGMLYSSRDAAKSWSRVRVPYAVRMEELANGNGVLATLTSDTIFSGNANSTAFLSNVDAGIYQGNTTTTSTPPDYPYYGLLRSFPLSSSSGSSGDDSGLNGGAIFGIVAASLFGVALIVLVIAIILGGVIFWYSRRDESTIGEASRLMANDEAL